MKPDACEAGRRFRKAMSLLKSWTFVRAALAHRVAATTEHLPAIEVCQPNTLLDAGANKGQFSLALRAHRPAAKIIAFEPLSAAADTYERVFAKDELASLRRVALANTEGTAEFYVADRSDSSSLLEQGEAQARAFGVHRIGTIEVPTTRLDTILDIAALAHPILLKVDVQGGEMGVFEGCDFLDEIDFIYVELSFVELYVGQPLFEDVNLYLSKRGFRIVGVFNQITTDACGPTQVDVLFQTVKMRR